MDAVDLLSENLLCNGHQEIRESADEVCFQDRLALISPRHVP